MKTAKQLRASISTVPGAAVVFALCLAAAPVLLAAQQAYPASPYATQGNPNAGPYAQPSPQNNYPQPEYQQPQYGYAQPQYSQPPQYPAQPAPQQSYAAPYPDQGVAQPGAPAQALSAQNLEQLLAPIALYPDALLAQILTASTYPAQVAVADQWLQQMRAQGYGSPGQVASGADAQTDWDPSVKALTAFPDVLDMLDHNLDWTTALGNAYYNQPQDVMQTVQVLRERAQQAGNLETTPQEDVTENQGYIDIAPPNPEVVYVPTYNPWDVYGAPIAPYSGFSLVGALGSFLGGSPIQYGLSFALGAFEHTPFGLMAWGLDWLTHSVLFNRSGYFTYSASVRDWGLPRGGPRAYDGWRERARASGFSNSDYRNRGYGGPGSGGLDRRYPTPQYSFSRGEAYGNRAPAQNYSRPAEPFREPARPEAGSYRGAQQPAYGYARPAVPAQIYQRPAPQTFAYRPQTFGSPAYGYGFANRPNYAAQPNYASRPGYGYGNSFPSYRPPQTNSRAFSGRSYAHYGNSMARNESGGFRGFGRQKEPKFSAPKYKAPKSFGGGHERAPKAPKMSHFGGGGGHHRF